MYGTAFIIVFFYVTRGDLHPGRYVPVPKYTWWGYLRSWIKQAVCSHFVTQLLIMFWSLINWTLSPRKPPDPMERRRKRVKEAMMHLNPPRRNSSRTARLFAAAVVAVQLASSMACRTGETTQALKLVVGGPPPEPSVMQQYLGAFSLVLAESEFQTGDLDELGIYNATWDTDSKPMGIDNRASASLSDDERDFKPGTLVPVIRDVYHCGLFSRRNSSFRYHPNM